MDDDRFDTLTRTMGTPSSRRAALGATLAGGLLGALGLARNVPEAKAQGGTCTLAFSANVRLGPSQGQPLSAEGQPGALRGNVVFGVDQTGRLTGELQVPSGERFPVMGQATGRSLQARIELAPRLALVVVGVGEQEVAACRGAIDGMLSGPQVGDLGDWHAAATGGGGGQGQGGQGRGGQSGGGQNAGDNTTRGGRDTSGGRSDRGGDGGGRGNQGSGAASGGNAGSTQGSGGSGQAPAAQGDVECPPRETFCDLEEGYCADLQLNFLNCGACGNVCSDPQPYCFGGRCLSEEEVDNAGQGLVCIDGFQACAGECVDVIGNAVHCGACGNACAEGTICQGGECTATGGGGCLEGLVDCGGTCVDVNIDPANCGGCGIACAAGEVCSGSLCVPAGGGGCKDGSLTYCGGSCVDLQTDPNNCGVCGVFCSAGSTCQFGACTATTTEAPALLTCADQGLIECFGVCVDLQTDPSNCGYCGEVCSSGQCATGICIEVVGPAPAEVEPELDVETSVCPFGTADCGGGCIDVISDPANCGSCGNVCSLVQQCILAACE